MIPMIVTDGRVVGFRVTDQRSLPVVHRLQSQIMGDKMDDRTMMADCVEPA